MSKHAPPPTGLDRRPSLVSFGNLVAPHFETFAKLSGRGLSGFHILVSCERNRRLCENTRDILLV